MVTKHSEKVTTYHCSKYPTICNRLDNMRRHIKKHPGQTDTPKTIRYEIKQMSPEPQRPKRQQKKKTPMTTRPYLNNLVNSNDYIYQQSLRLDQKPIPWWLIPVDIPEKTRPVWGNPRDPRLPLQDLEEMNKQLLAELEVSSSSSDSSLESPIPDKDLQDLQDHPRRLAYIRWTLGGKWLSPHEHCQKFSL